MTIRENVFDIETARANVKRTMAFPRENTAVSKPPQQQKACAIEKYEGKFASIPVNTAIWYKSTGIFDKTLEGINSEEPEDKDEFYLIKEITGVGLFSKSRTYASFELSLVKFAEPTTLLEYIQLVKQSRPSFLPYKEKMQDKKSQYKNARIGSRIGVELNFSRKIAGNPESVTDVLVMLDAQTILKAHYSIEIGQHKLYLGDIKRMLKGTEIKIKPMQTNQPENSPVNKEIFSTSLNELQKVESKSETAGGLFSRLLKSWLSR